MSPYWSWALTLIGCLGFRLAGKRIWWAWYINIANQLIWAAYAINTRQWGFLFGIPVYLLTFVPNAISWTREHRAPSGPPDLVDFIREQRDWGYETFGPDYTGTLPHLKKEIVEVEADQDDLEEWIDVILLGISGAARSGGGRTAEEIAEALLAKYTKNRARTWPDWREVAAGEAIEHDRSKDPA